jgi:hypothetical protein
VTWALLVDYSLTYHDYFFYLPYRSFAECAGKAAEWKEILSYFPEAEINLIGCQIL